MVWLKNLNSKIKGAYSCVPWLNISLKQFRGYLIGDLTCITADTLAFKTSGLISGIVTLARYSLNGLFGLSWICSPVFSGLIYKDWVIELVQDLAIQKHWVFPTAFGGAESKSKQPWMNTNSIFSETRIGSFSCGLSRSTEAPVGGWTWVSTSIILQCPKWRFYCVHPPGALLLTGLALNSMSNLWFEFAKSYID